MKEEGEHCIENYDGIIVGTGRVWFDEVWI